jgi:hypothetical protein
MLQPRTVCERVSDFAQRKEGSAVETGRTKSDAPLRESDLRAFSEAEKRRRIPKARKIRAKHVRAIQSARQVAPVTAGK